MSTERPGRDEAAVLAVMQLRWSVQVEDRFIARS